MQKKNLDKNKPFFIFILQWAVHHYLTHCPYGLKAAKISSILTHPAPSYLTEFTNLCYLKVLGMETKWQYWLTARRIYCRGQGSKHQRTSLLCPHCLYIRSDNVIKTNSYPKKLLLKECLMLFLMKYYSPPFYGLYLPAWSLQRYSVFCFTGKAFVLQYTQKC